jgi:tetratricopeptide (TPR) repeat protein
MLRALGCQDGNLCCWRTCQCCRLPLPFLFDRWSGTLQEAERAIGMYEAAAQLAAPSPAIYAKLGAAHAASHSFRAAAAAYGRALRLAPRDAEVRLAKIGVYVRTRAGEQAARELADCDAHVEVCRLKRWLSCCDVFCLL